jgi:hypothetical protein
MNGMIASVQGLKDWEIVFIMVCGLPFRGRGDQADTMLSLSDRVWASRILHRRRIARQNG